MQECNLVWSAWRYGFSRGIHFGIIPISKKFDTVGIGRISLLQIISELGRVAKH
jgi:hypothetical protein